MVWQTYQSVANCNKQAKANTDLIQGHRNIENNYTCEISRVNPLLFVSHFRKNASQNPRIGEEMVD